MTLINVVIETIDDAGGNYDLFATFELAPSSEPTEGDDIGYTVICMDDQGTPANVTTPLNSLKATSLVQLYTLAMVLEVPQSLSTQERPMSLFWTSMSAPAPTQTTF